MIFTFPRKPYTYMQKQVIITKKPPQNQMPNNTQHEKRQLILGSNWERQNISH